MNARLNRFVVDASQGNTCLDWVGDRESCLQFLVDFNRNIDTLIETHGTESVATSVWALYMGSHVLHSAFDPAAVDDIALIFSSMETLYSNGFAAHCPNRLHYFDDLATAAYMLWDMSSLEYLSFRDDQSLHIPLGKLFDFGLSHNHAVVQESFLHGLGHRQSDHPDFVDHRLAEFLCRTDISEEIRCYAKQCVTGRIQ